jgi:hypothetical protein
MSEEPLTEDTMVAALLREREGLVQRGLKERVTQVDEQLKLRGYTPTGKRKPQAPAKPPETETPKERQQPGTEKT